MTKVRTLLVVAALLIATAAVVEETNPRAKPSNNYDSYEMLPLFGMVLRQMKAGR